MEFWNEQILYCKQYGLHKGFSTTHAIINQTDNIESTVDKCYL